MNWKGLHFRGQNGGVTFAEVATVSAIVVRELGKERCERNGQTHKTALLLLFLFLFLEAT